MNDPKVKAVPDGMHTVTPHLICAGTADAVEFYKKAFNAVDVGRVPGPQGKLMHACIRIGDSAVMLVDEFPDWGKFGPKSLKGSPVTITSMSRRSTQLSNVPSVPGRRSGCHSRTRSGAIVMACWKTRLVIIGR